MLADSKPAASAQATTDVALAIDVRGLCTDAGLNAIQLARVEQLHPYPVEEIVGRMAGMTDLQEVIWVQDEPRNMGAWRHTLATFLESGSLRGLPLGYVGRPEQGSPAEGYGRDHTLNQQRILDTALKPGTADIWLI